MAIFFTETQIKAIAAALGDTSDGLTGSEIDFLMSASRMVDYGGPAQNKRTRLYNAFAHSQNTTQDRVNILAFIRKSMKPESHVMHPGRFEKLRAMLNEALAFAGIAVNASGHLIDVEFASTISAAKQRATELRSDMVLRGVHPDVLAFCREELVASNYFHAVLEAVKSVLDKLRTMTGIPDDGVSLIDKTLGGDTPRVRINSLSGDSEKSEQKGFANLLRGLVGMFRNTTAHAAKVNWPMSKEDAEDLLSTVSLAHRRLDNATVAP